MIDDELVALTNRTLYAFAMRDEDLIVKLGTERWSGYTVGDVCGALALLCMKLPQLDVVKDGAVAQLMILDRDGRMAIDTCPPGISAGSRMAAAGLNNDVVAVKDVLTAFLDQMGEDEDELQEQIGLMFTAVFSAAAALVEATATEMN